LRLPRHGSLSRVIAASPSGNWQVRVGREMVWFGNMEDEGSTLWLLNQAGEGYDTVAYRGRRSMLQVRSQGAAAINTNLEERIVCYHDRIGYTLYGTLKTGNAKNAGAAVDFFTSRPGGSAIGSSDLGIQVTGTTDWTRYYNNFTPLDNTNYFDVRLKSEGPPSGAGYAWFDDVGLVEWQGWQPLTDPVSISHPNEWYWVQLRTTDAASGATLSYEETDYNPPVSITRHPNPAPAVRPFWIAPNPCRTRAVIRSSSPLPTPYSLSVYDASGRLVRILHQSPIVNRQSPVLVWDGLDNRGRAVGSDTYFCTLTADGRSQTRQAILLR
jgi:hypothetical protein